MNQKTLLIREHFLSRIIPVIRYLAMPDKLFTSFSKLVVTGLS